MKNMDVIFLSYAKKHELKQITQQAIQTLINSSTEVKFNIKVVESEKNLEPYQYDNAETVYYNIPFNYNKYMNMAFESGNSDYVAFCNNDLIFIDQWADNIIKYMEEYELDSASPMCPLHHGNYIINQPVIIGSKTKRELVGWCIVVKRKFFEELGGFDDYVNFYTSDDAYERQLLRHGGKHGLVTRSSVIHLRSKTLDTIKHPEEITIGQIKKFNKVNYTNMWGVGSE